MRRGQKPLGPDVIRAAKLSRVPGVTIALACKRFGVSKAAVDRARKAKLPGTEPSLAEQALAALTHNGVDATGSLAELEGVARWIDYLDHDACTVADVRRMLAPFEATGQLTIEGDRWTLNLPWP